MCPSCRPFWRCRIRAYSGMAARKESKSERHIDQRGDVMRFQSPQCGSILPISLSIAWFHLLPIFSPAQCIPIHAYSVFRPFWPESIDPIFPAILRRTNVPSTDATFQADIITIDLPPTIMASRHSSITLQAFVLKSTGRHALYTLHHGGGVLFFRASFAGHGLRSHPLCACVCVDGCVHGPNRSNVYDMSCQNPRDQGRQGCLVASCEHNHTSPRTYTQNLQLLSIQACGHTRTCTPPPLAARCSLMSFDSWFIWHIEHMKQRDRRQISPHSPCGMFVCWVGSGLLVSTDGGLMV